jgi:hypothetical protein
LRPTVAVASRTSLGVVTIASPSLAATLRAIHVRHRREDRAIFPALEGRTGPLAFREVRRVVCEDDRGTWQ